MKTMQKIKKAVTKAMLGGALLSVGIGGCEVIDGLDGEARQALRSFGPAPQVGEEGPGLYQAAPQDSITRGDRFTTKLSVNHNESFLVDGD